jgi:hypothetical protein
MSGQEKEVEHTALPWRSHNGIIVADIPKGEFNTTAVAYVCDEFRHAGGLCYGKEREANSEFIVKACNSYYARDSLAAELVKTLEYVLEDDGLIPRASSECRKVVRATLSKAGVK